MKKQAISPPQTSTPCNLTPIAISILIGSSIARTSAPAVPPNLHPQHDTRQVFCNVCSMCTHYMYDQNKVF